MRPLYFAWLCPKIFCIKILSISSSSVFRDLFARQILAFYIANVRLSKPKPKPKQLGGCVKSENRKPSTFQTKHICKPTVKSALGLHVFIGVLERWRRRVLHAGRAGRAQLRRRILLLLLATPIIIIWVLIFVVLHLLAFVDGEKWVF